MLTINHRSISFYMGKLDTFFFRREEEKLSKIRMNFASPSAALLALNLLGLLSSCDVLPSVLPSYIAAIQDRRQSCILTLECSN